MPLSAELFKTIQTSATVLDWGREVKGLGGEGSGWGHHETCLQEHQTSADTVACSPAATHSVPDTLVDTAAVQNLAQSGKDIPPSVLI